MTKQIAAFLAGFGIACLVGLSGLGKNYRRVMEIDRGEVPTPVDLNEASQTELLELGLDNGTVDRVIENRPYRSTLELVSRVMIPTGLYSDIKHRISVSKKDESVKVAS